MTELNSPPKITFYIVWFFSCYLVIAGLAHSISRKKFDKQRVKEITYAFFAITLYSVLSYITAIWFGLGWTKIYLNVSDYGVLWYFASYFVMFVLHDTYFYWSHRLMHQIAFLRKAHGVHHQSVNPSPFTAHSFHLIEAFVHGAFFVMMSLLVPFHWSVFLVFHLFATAINVYGHLGFSLLRGREDQGIFKLFNHPTTHQWHHRHVHGNYSLYCTFWDRLMKTYRGYISSFDE